MGYLELPNYANNLRSLGFSDDDLRGGGSDRLVDGRSRTATSTQWSPAFASTTKQVRTTSRCSW